jgi:choline kinase
MKAILLAAGRGSRLGTHTELRPKSLVAVGNTTLIEHSIQTLRGAGLTEVVVVIGYLHEQVQAAISQRFGETFCRTIVNPDYTRGSASSLRCAVDAIEGELFLIEADLLYHEDVIHRMSRVVDNALALGHFGHDRIEGKITLKDGFVRSLTWGGASAHADGDWVGITRLSAEAAQFLRLRLLEPFDATAPLSQHYTTYIFELVSAFPFRTVNINDVPWIEIDNESDLLRAKNDVYPLLQSFTE